MNLADYGGIDKLKHGRVVRYICDAVVSLASKYPAESITIQMITAEAEISKQTFYNHFPDKYALFNYVFYHDIENQIENYAPSEVITKLLPGTFNKKLSYYRSVAHTNALNGFQNFLYTFLLNYYHEVIHAYWDDSNITPTILFCAEVYTEITASSFITFLKDSQDMKKFSIFDLGANIYAAIPLSLYPAFANAKDTISFEKNKK